MKSIICLVICFPFFLFSQTNAVTDEGDQVLLYDDGTWKYIDAETEAKNEIPINTEVFKKDKNSKFLLKSTAFNVGIWLDAKKWKFTKGSDTDDSEYSLLLKGEDLYGMVITEKIGIPLESLREIAISNAKEVAPDTKVSNQEYRTVNGVKVLMLEMNGTLSGINFGYKGYYFSNDNGTMQLVLYSAKNLMKQYDKDIQKLLNGFVELN